MIDSTIEWSIRHNFPGPNNSDIRDALRAAVRSGNVMGLAKQFGLTGRGYEALRAVQQTINSVKRNRMALILHLGS